MQIFATNLRFCYSLTGRLIALCRLMFWRWGSTRVSALQDYRSSYTKNIQNVERILSQMLYLSILLQLVLKFIFTFLYRLPCKSKLPHETKILTQSIVRHNKDNTCGREAETALTSYKNNVHMKTTIAVARKAQHFPTISTHLIIVG
jgi:hypothetical protein